MSSGLPSRARTSACGMPFLMLFMALANSARARGGSVGGCANAVEASDVTSTSPNKATRIRAMTFSPLFRNAAGAKTLELATDIIARSGRSGQLDSQALVASWLDPYHRVQGPAAEGGSWAQRWQWTIPGEENARSPLTALSRLSLARRSANRLVRLSDIEYHQMPIGTIFARSLPLPGLILLVSEYRYRRRRT